MIQIRPAIDLLNGKCVRLAQGKFDEVTTYGDDAVAIARSFEDAGCTHLHVVDLDGARSGQGIHWKVLQRLCRETRLTIDFGGGLRAKDALIRAFECGAAQVSVGSVALKNPELFEEWLSTFGPERIILAADVRGNYVTAHGWQSDSSEEVFSWIRRFIASGLRYVMSTDVSRDGVMQGPALPLYEALRENFKELFILASGGVTSLQDVLALSRIGVSGVIIGRALYEGSLSLKDLEGYICSPNV